MLWIEHDGATVVGCFWRAVELEKAVREYRHFRQMLRSAAARDC